MIEEWRILPSIPIYEVSSFGRVRRLIKYNNSTKDGILKNCISNPNSRANYFVVSLCYQNKKKNHFVHKLVMEAFIGLRQNGIEINHIDGNKLNNRLSNLEYVTRQGNIDHGKKMKLYRAWNKGIKTGIVPRTAFKKGNIPWNKYIEELEKTNE